MNKRFLTKDVRPALNHQLQVNLKQSDQTAQQLTGSALSDYLAQQNQQNADLAQNTFEKLNQKLIVDSSRQTKIVHHQDL